MKKLAVIAFGGNALLRSGQKGTCQEQMQNVADCPAFWQPWTGLSIPVPGSRKGMADETSPAF